MSKTNDFIVIGIGSSAGGLEALQVLLSKIDTALNASYIIAQHLSPTHKSMMVELLSRITNLPVIEIHNGMIIKPKTVYMTPENTDVYVANGKLYLKTIDSTFGPKPSVNYFFNSLAQHYNSHSIGIILSGTGTDGAFGIRAIKAAGGITIAQSPATAKYDGMPIAAINTGKVDVVVPIDTMGDEIARMIVNLGRNLTDSINEQMLHQIYRILFNDRGVDFSQYKRSTLTRRIERRIAALKADSLADYIDTLRSDPQEIDALYHDLLIGVTEFFRDKEAFDALFPYLKELLEKKEPGEEIRFWVIGCSTGEEAYSLAIVLSEILKERISRYKIKIFATDIDDESLKIARAGIYSETSFINVDKSIIQRYFSIQKNHFEVKKSLRELVVFSRHNIMADSPFLRMDLISCRNMLIYFNQALQNRFFPIIHYALKDQGLLFLGKSESISQNGDLFVLLDKQAKIFRSQYTGIKEPPKLYNYAPLRGYDEPKPKHFRNEDEMLEEGILEATLKYLLNQCIVVNSSNEIVYIKGEIPYLVHPQGRLSNNVFKSIREELILDLRSAISEAMKNKNLQKTPFRQIQLNNTDTKYVRIIVIPFDINEQNTQFAGLFFQSENDNSLRGNLIMESNTDEAVLKLANELNLTKAHLQNVIEELETSYEEMQSLNEELSSSNEELQSSNEELETTNEELQSTNEELQTAYTELKALYDDKDMRTKQLEDLTRKLMGQTENLRKQKELTEGIINTTPIAITMVDADGMITFANTNALNLFKMSLSQITNRSYDSNKWEIVSTDNTPFPKEKLPFNIIRQTFEPVYNVQHKLRDGEGNEVSVSVSGAPLFDAKGGFTGAVFSLEDISHKSTSTLAALDNSELINQSLVNSFKKFQSEQLQEEHALSFGMMQYTSAYLSTHIRSYVNEMVLLTKAIHESGNELASELENTLNQMITDIQNNTSFFGIQPNKPTTLLILLEEIKSYFSDWLNSNMLDINFDITEDTVLNPKEAKIFLVSVFEHIACVTSQDNEKPKLVQIFSFRKDQTQVIRFLVSKMKNIQDGCSIKHLKMFARDFMKAQLEVKTQTSDAYELELRIGYRE